MRSESDGATLSVVPFGSVLQKRMPSHRLYHHPTILCPDQLYHIHLCRHVEHIHQILQATDECSSESLLQQSKAPVRSKLGVAKQHEGHGDVPGGDRTIPSVRSTVERFCSCSAWHNCSQVDASVSPPMSGF